MYLPAAMINTKGANVPIVQATDQPRASPPGSRGSEQVPRDWIFFFKFESSRIRLAAWAVSYFTDQLMTPCFSGGSTINGTPGGDRWARVLGGQIGWLTEPLHRVDADCSGPTNLKVQTRKKNPPHPKHTAESTAARRPRSPRDGARRNIPRVSPYSPASMDPGFVEIDIVQLSQAVNTTNVTHTDTQTD